MIVTLSWAEVTQGAIVGVLRQVSNIKRARVDANGFAGDGWGVHVEGCLGEMAAAKALGVYWAGSLGALRVPDIKGYQVRTAPRQGLSLIAHREDADDAKFLLVVGTAPSYCLAGWILGRDAKRAEWWRDPVGGRPAFFVPSSALRPMTELER